MQRVSTWVPPDLKERGSVCTGVVHRQEGATCPCGLAHEGLGIGAGETIARSCVLKEERGSGYTDDYTCQNASN